MILVSKPLFVCFFVIVCFVVCLFVCLFSFVVVVCFVCFLFDVDVGGFWVGFFVVDDVLGFL